MRNTDGWEGVSPAASWQLYSVQVFLLGSRRADRFRSYGPARLVSRLRTPSLAVRCSGDTARLAIAGALRAAVGAETGQSAAAMLFRPSDTVAIKLNCLAGRLLSPRVELVEALVELIAEAGVDRRRIIVFERSSRELERAGFTIRRDGPPYVCIGTDNDYEKTPSTSGAIGSCFARLVTTGCTALVSFGVVKDHDLSGISAGMKNWYGVIHNPNKYHDNGCDPYIADVARHPYVAGKLRLTVLDGVVAQCHGGPAFRSGATFNLSELRRAPTRWRRISGPGRSLKRKENDADCRPSKRREDRCGFWQPPPAMVWVWRTPTRCAWCRREDRPAPDARARCRGCRLGGQSLNGTGFLIARNLGCG